jgi:hypothetical protein
MNVHCSFAFLPASLFGATVRQLITAEGPLDLITAMGCFVQKIAQAQEAI